MAVKENWNDGESLTATQINAHGTQINDNATNISGTTVVANRAVANEILTSGNFQETSGSEVIKDQVLITDSGFGDFYEITLDYQKLGGTAGTASIDVSGASLAGLAIGRTNGIVRICQDNATPANALFTEHGVDTGGANVDVRQSSVVGTDWISGSYWIRLRINDAGDTSGNVNWIVRRNKGDV